MPTKNPALRTLLAQQALEISQESEDSVETEEEEQAGDLLDILGGDVHWGADLDFERTYDE